MLIYIVDTGVRATHSDLRGRVERGRNFLSFGNPDDTDDLDPVGHGTSVISLFSFLKNWFR